MILEDFMILNIKMTLEEVGAMRRDMFSTLSTEREYQIRTKPHHSTYRACQELLAEIDFLRVCIKDGDQTGYRELFSKNDSPEIEECKYDIKNIKESLLRLHDKIDSVESKIYHLNSDGEDRV